MIHVQIATDLTSTGVAGTRWVLIEPSETAAPAAPPPGTGAPLPGAALQGALPDGLQGGLPDGLPAPPARPQLGWWTWAITGLGLAAALMAGLWQLGPPALSGPQAADGLKPSATLPGTAREMAPLAPILPAAPLPGVLSPGGPATADERLPAPQPAAPASAAPRHEPLITASLS